MVFGKKLAAVKARAARQERAEIIALIEGEIKDQYDLMEAFPASFAKQEERDATVLSTLDAIQAKVKGRDA